MMYSIIKFTILRGGKILFQYISHINWSAFESNAINEFNTYTKY